MFSQTVFNLADYSKDHGCNENIYTKNKFQDNKIVAVAEGSCSIQKKAWIAQKYGMKGLLIVKTKVHSHKLPLRKSLYFSDMNISFYY